MIPVRGRWQLARAWAREAEAAAEPALPGGAPGCDWDDLAVQWRAFGAAVRDRAPDLAITEQEIRRIWWRLTGPSGPMRIDVRATILEWRQPGARVATDSRERPAVPRPLRPRAHRRRAQPLRRWTCSRTEGETR